MPQPRKYTDNAARQAAYRARKAAAPTASSTAAPSYAKWRKAIQHAYTLLDDTREEISDWIEERSERWHESDRGEAMQSDRDQLSEILNSIDSLNIRQ